MIVKSTRLGELKVSRDDVISFSKGLPGFPNEQKFILLPYDDNSPFAFLQSLAEPNLTFLIVEPFSFFLDYEFSLDEHVVRELSLSDDNPPRIFNIVTVPENVEEMTANLLAPLIINSKQRTAQQIVLEKVSYTTRHYLFPNGFPKQEKEGGK